VILGACWRAPIDLLIVTRLPTPRPTSRRSIQGGYMHTTGGRVASKFSRGERCGRRAAAVGATGRGHRRESAEAAHTAPRAIDTDATPIAVGRCNRHNLCYGIIFRIMIIAGAFAVRKHPDRAPMIVAQRPPGDPARPRFWPSPSPPSTGHALHAPPPHDGWRLAQSLALGVPDCACREPTDRESVNRFPLPVTQRNPTSRGSAWGRIG